MRIELNNNVGYWKYSWDITNIDDVISSAYDVAKTVESTYDGHGLWEGDKSIEWIKSINGGNIGNMVLNGIGVCETIHTNPYNEIYSGAWVNIVDKNNPKQQIRNSLNGNYIYHNHVEIQRRLGFKIPNYTFVFYIQMPDNLSDNDGKLFIKDKKGNEFGILPEVGDLIILEGDVPHAPIDAPNSTKDRIVLAGNVCFENIKREKTLV